MLSETPVILENEKVLLRPLEMSDFDNLISFVINEPDIWKYSLVPLGTKDELTKYIADTEDARKHGKEYAFIVFDKVKNKFAGSTRFYDIQLQNKSLQLGYTWYGKEFQGTYLNKNCKYLLLEYAFETLGLERVEFRADNDNERSKKAMLSIGCIAEGILRNHLPTAKGGRRDSIILSILKNEWHDKVKNLLSQKI